MGRAPCCEKVGLKRGPWTPDEDEKLVSYINEHGHGSWRALPKRAGLLRCGKSCRLRWTNYLRPDIKRGEFSASEEQRIIQLHALLGNKWSAIASHLPKRTDNEIKNYWNTHMKKKLTKMGIDPTTHKPMGDNTPLVGNKNLMGNNKDSSDTKAHEDNNAALRLPASNTVNGSSTFCHMAQWESARLEAETRLVQESKLRAKGLWPMVGAMSKGASSSLPSSPTPPSLLTSFGPQRFSSLMNNGTMSLGALKAFSAVELMHALQNWEKSLQGQAGLLWPDSWRLSSANFAKVGEGQAESSSCSSHSTDAQTACSTVGAIPSSPNTDHRSPTSTLCSLDCQKAKQKMLDTTSPLPCSHAPTRLSWNDALSMQPNLEVPSKKSTNHACKAGEKQQSFSSLMLDAMYGERGMMTSPFLSSVEDGSEKDILPEQHTCEEEEEDVRDKKDMGGMEESYISKKAEDVKVDAKVDKEDVADDERLCLSEQVGSDFAAADADDQSALQELRDPCTDDGDGEGDDGRTAIDTEMMNSEMFKDLPKLKEAGGSKACASYTALLSEEISDCWSNLMLKEQVNSPIIHITF